MDERTAAAVRLQALIAFYDSENLDTEFISNDWDGVLREIKRLARIVAGLTE